MIRLINHPAMFNINRNSMKFGSKIKYKERQSELEETSSSAIFRLRARQHIFDDICMPDAVCMD